MSDLPDGLISYGPDANCTFALCPLDSTVFTYRPSLAANAIFIALFGIAMLLHLYRGLRWREWSYMSCMVVGCIVEMIGYGGRVLLYSNPWSFAGFMMEIVCITTAPVFYCASIYVLIVRMIDHIGPQHARFAPKFFLWFFIPCDVLSLVLQGVGGALSASSAGDSNAGVDVALAGLCFQVFTLVLFVAMCFDLANKYRRSAVRKPLEMKMKIFLAFLSAAIVLILVRCIYRIDELSEGYSGPLLANQGLFIALEGVIIVVAVFCLAVAHPGPVLGRRRTATNDVEKVVQRSSEEGDL